MLKCYHYTTGALFDFTVTKTGFEPVTSRLVYGNDNQAALKGKLQKVGLCCLALYRLSYFVIVVRQVG